MSITLTSNGARLGSPCQEKNAKSSVLLNGKRCAPGELLDAKVPPQRLVHVLGVDDGAAPVVAAERARVHPLREVQPVGLAHRTARPGLVLLHDDVAADGPVVLARLRVVEVRAPEVRADHHHHAVGHPVLLGVLPQVVDRVGEVAEQPLVVRVVVRVGVESSEPQVRATATPVLNASTVSCAWRRKLL